MTPQPADVTLVIPGRNAERTISQCLGAAVPLLGGDGLHEIIFVDDGSTDGTLELARRHPVTCLEVDGRGPGAARNAGWRAAGTPLIWFMDSDCVVEPTALRILLSHLEDPSVAGVGGSYSNMEPESLLARLIHEEIRERHLSMPRDVNFLGSFNVIYRRDVLRSVGGFDETQYYGEDADLSYRIAASGHRLRVEPRALTGHYHPTRLGRYLRSQRLHGYWGAHLYLRHRGRALGNSYSSFLDHVQPGVAILALIGLACFALPFVRVVSVGLLLALLLLQLPMTVRLVRSSESASMLWFIPLGMIRAVARGVGMIAGAGGSVASRLRSRRTLRGIQVSPDAPDGR